MSRNPSYRKKGPGRRHLQGIEGAVLSSVMTESHDTDLHVRLVKARKLAQTYKHGMRGRAARLWLTTVEGQFAAEAERARQANLGKRA